MDKAQLLAKRAKAARAFLLADPLASLMLPKMCLHPLATLLPVYVTRSGQQWDTTQRARQAQAMELEGKGLGEQTSRA
eukprot:9483151-Prorocentrum_lima.AAC.1